MPPLRIAIVNDYRMVLAGLTAMLAPFRDRIDVVELDANRPVYLRVVARGKASRGRKDKVEERAPELQVGGEIRRNGGAWAWTPFG